MMSLLGRRASLIVAALTLALLALSSPLLAQSTAGLQGAVTDQSGAALPDATVKVTNNATGDSRVVKTDSDGNYQTPSLVPGTYSLLVSATGMQTRRIQDVVINVGAAITLNVKLNVGSAQEVVTVVANAPVVNTASMTVGQVINQKTVQLAPLNGRHFVDLGTLIPGSVTAPANGFLTQPIRGQGSLSFDTAGQREDTVNFMINGINLNDMVQNQITFQPTINTVGEFNVDNSSFSAQYGRSSGAIVNIATRSGTNTFHGEAYNYLRNNFFDSRNYFNPQYTVSGVHVRQSQFIRNQYGGDVGGPIWKDHTFFFASYEGTRQRQGETVNTGVPPQGSVGSDSTIQKLLALLPAPNSGSNFVGSASALVTIDQGTIDVSHQIGTDDRLHAYYAIQKDSRNEPLSPTVADTIPGYGDSRPARRQLFTLVETHTFGSNAVNEARIGFNRIYITFTPVYSTNPTTFGISDGIDSTVGLPQTTITSLGLTFGGPSGEPQGRGDTIGVLSDTFSLLKGNHSFRFGGEYRRFINSNFTGDTGTFGFPTLADFLNDEPTSFSVTPGTRPSRVFTSAIGVYAIDTWKIRPSLNAELGFRFEWNGSPTEGENRFVLFQPSTDSLVRVGTNGISSSVYNQNYLLEPRLGLAWDVGGKNKTVLHLDYGILYNQPETNLVTGLSTNPPFAVPVSVAVNTPSTALTMQNAFSSAGAAGTIAPYSVTTNFRDPQVQSYNLILQQQLASALGFQIGFVGSKGTHLQMYLNGNQPSAGVRPFTKLSTSSTIDPGVNLGNILTSASVGNSNYSALWASLEKRLGSSIQFNTSYTWSKSLDYNSYNLASTSYGTPQNSLDPRGDYGPSDFDVRDRWVFSGVYALPFGHNRLDQGWLFSAISSLQTGNPFTVHTTLANNGVAGLTRPNVVGRISYSYAHASNGNIQYIPQAICGTPVSGCAFSSPGTGFGDESRGEYTGPGFEDVDIAVQKNTKITERLSFQLRTDAFNLMNHPNFGQPSSSFTPGSSSSTFGQLTSTRFPVGDFGSSRQLQVSGKFVF
ncbi:MAG TPA: carboxypeptidase regulatory-like domain-containing protein [Terracidiphilus sp.]|nr:carboxypeptidase regulatory-like domain-containing protein [Terracidiphilus sp.]